MGFWCGEPTDPMCLHWGLARGMLRPPRTPGIPRPCGPRGRAAGRCRRSSLAVRRTTSGTQCRARGQLDRLGRNLAHRSTPYRTCRPAAWTCGCSPDKARRSNEARDADIAEARSRRQHAERGRTCVEAQGHHGRYVVLTGEIVVGSYVPRLDRRQHAATGACAWRVQDVRISEVRVRSNRLPTGRSDDGSHCGSVPKHDVVGARGFTQELRGLHVAAISLCLPGREVATVHVDRPMPDHRGHGQ